MKRTVAGTVILLVSIWGGVALWHWLEPMWQFAVYLTGVVGGSVGFVLIGSGVEQ
jgi:hypothetical protein